MLTESTEMYLITIYRLTRNHNEFAHTKEIAEGMNVSLPSVSEKLKKLSEQGYLNYEWRKGANLTQEGERIALSVLRKHRLIETFLVVKAGYEIDEVHDEACKLEHAMTDRLIDYLDKSMDYPKTDPHGHPIPDKTGVISESNSKPLEKAHQGEQLVISQVSDWNNTELSYLIRIGIKPGAIVNIVDIAPFKGPITLELGEKTVALTPEIASRIYVIKNST